MRKIMCSFLVITALIAFNCSDNSTGPGSPTVSSSVIDISHNGTGGFTFGLHGADQLKRFQTFKADSTCLNITGIDVKIRRNVSSVAYDNVTVELYETAGNLPTNLLAVSSINIDSLGMNFTVLNAPLKYSSLTAGHTYAIVLGQSNVMAINNGGFEWCTSNVDTNLNFGKYNGTGWVSEPWLGDGWLKVYVDKTVRTNEYTFPAGTQVVFFDDFQRTTGVVGNGWICPLHPTYAANTNYIDIYDIGGGAKVARIKGDIWFANGDTTWTDFTISAKIKANRSVSNTGLYFRYRDVSNRYAAGLWDDTTLALRKTLPIWNVVRSAKVSYDTSGFYNLKIVVEGNRFRIYFNNSPTPNIDYTDISPIPNGSIGICCDYNPDLQEILFDDVLVTVP